MSKPLVVDLDAGSAWVCACGRSEKLPWCDGSHQGTGIGPMEVVLDKPGRVAICTCGKSAKKPYCDGSHAKLADE